ncbi:MAG: hypothetical protein KBF99_16945 [Leptospiraceae bacterium]|nr:hypothetical protein [Leptospiraceae bacterium]MBK7057219.1 hypothetical protein [Leptospiraceae bacterium]MBP9164869.1 hypothetical protein [Leptospiraceae bacterium]
MIKILKDNLIFVLAIGIFWLIAFPVVIFKRHAILNWYAITMSPSGHSPKVMRKFLDKGDGILNKNLEDAIKSPRLKEELENVKNRPAILTGHLKNMEEACDYYKSVANKNEVLQYPSWLDRNIRWTSDQELSADGIGKSRKRLPEVTAPDEYWRKNADSILDALDYYKRGLNYSGPEIIAADKIRSVAKAICRPEEIILAYTTFLNFSDAYVEEILQEETEELVKSKQSFFAPLLRIFGLAPAADRNEMYGLNPLMKKSIIWARIKKNIKEGIKGSRAADPNLPLLADYIRGVNILLLDTNLRNSSPHEADALYETILYFLQGTTDSGQQRNERFFRFKRGILLFNTGEFERAKMEFTAAKEFDNLKEESPISMRLIASHIFQSNLMIAKCNFKLGKYKEALLSLKSVENLLSNIDGRTGGAVEIDLLNDYKNSLRETLKKLDRFKEADEIE